MDDHAELIARLRAHAEADDGGLLVDDLYEAADVLEALVRERGEALTTLIDSLLTDEAALDRMARECARAAVRGLLAK